MEMNVRMLRLPTGVLMGSLMLPTLRIPILTCEFVSYAMVISNLEK